MWMKDAADIAPCVLAAEQLIFTALYTTRSPWWTTDPGRVYVAKSVVWTLVVL
ncbi:hypothetical protein GPOL_c12730 [Gordonia polyisoprenivorans VH2]|uniref:Uncharacterized protein n=1 Tax=Gordonia polyisoprenivorans (strain DSM 44266 / VH2) TaxID=1112204 RepID=H6N3G9_GORPV|nr:hypothetical protein GPOL_c12730 [Gordonia polyisoprenivorans VH2]